MIWKCGMGLERTAARRVAKNSKNVAVFAKARHVTVVIDCLGFHCKVFCETACAFVAESEAHVGCASRGTKLVASLVRTKRGGRHSLMPMLTEKKPPAFCRGKLPLPPTLAQMCRRGNYLLITSGMAENFKEVVAYGERMTSKQGSIYRSKCT